MVRAIVSRWSAMFQQPSRWFEGFANSPDERKASMWNRLKSLVRFGRMSEEDFREQQEKLLEVAPVPVFWLFGKTGSGKTSIVKYLTGADQAEIGTGFRPQTRFSRQYDFPSDENPVMRFLDTRGLGESDYDPAEDVEQFQESTHVMIVTVRVLDHALEDVVGALRRIRQSQPHRPVILALTCLHDAYPQQQHPTPDPFEEQLIPEDAPRDLQRSLQQQQRRFEGLVDRIVPIDLTPPEDGFDEPHFGGERLKSALIDVLPAAYRQTLLNLEDALKPLKSLRERRAMPYIIGYSTMAATAAAVPVPWVDIPVVMAIQSHLAYQLASIYGQPFNSQLMTRMAGSLGGRLLSRMMVRESLKVVPFVGMAANAALAFAYTFASGKVWCWYFGQVRAGNAPSNEDLQRIWKEQLDVAIELWKKHRKGENNS